MYFPERLAPVKKELLHWMSPKLQGEVARITNQKWIQRVWYFNIGSEDKSGTAESQ